MRSYRELSLRYLKDKKSRTFTIIFGIIVSVALITGVFSLTDSFINKMIKDYEKVSKEHGQIYNIKGKDIPKIINNINLEMAGVSYGGYEVINDENEDKGKFYLTEATKDIMYLKSYENNIVRGNLPTKATEILANEEYLKEIGKDIGDTITITLKNYNNDTIEEKTGKVVGTTKNLEIVYMIDESSIINDERYIILLRFKDVKQTVEVMTEMGKSLGVDDILSDDVVPKDNPGANENKNYITFLGEETGDGRGNLIYSLRMILVFLVIISSIGLIYNGFMISINDRKKEFSLLRAVGMSKKQIRNIVIKEASIIGAIGIILGLVLGIVGIFILLKVVSNINVDILGKIDFKVSWASIIGSILVSVFTIAISILIPIRETAKISPVDGMKNTFTNEENIKLKRGKGLFNRFFGSAGILANKNLRRNKGRFRSVVLGFSLSIFIFVAFSSYIEISSKAKNIQNEVSKYEIQVNADADIEKIKEIDKVKDAYKETVLDMIVFNGENKMYYQSDILNDDIYTDKFNSIVESNLNYELIYVNEKSLRDSILKDDSISIEELKKGVVIQNKLLTLEKNKKNLIDITKLKVGDKIDIGSKYGSVEDEEPIIFLNDVEVAYISEIPNVYSKEYIRPIRIYVGEYIINSISKEKISTYENFIKIIPQDEKDIEAIYSELKENGSEYGVSYLSSMDEDQKQWNKMMLIIKIGVYGFLTLITVITLSNIITSVRSSIENRRKEIALLRSVGTSNKFIKKMIFIENINYYLYSMLFGGTFGVIVSIIITKTIEPLYSGVYVFPIKPLILVSIILLVVVFILSKYSINKFFSKSIIDEIREE